MSGKIPCVPFGTLSITGNFDKIPHVELRISSW
jgi:hypothetical protein